MHYHIVLCARHCLQQSEFGKMKNSHLKKVQDEDVVKKTEM